MPRTTTVESPGCPPFRALTFDVLGLVKVIEARGKQGGVPKVVERWGDPDTSRCVLAASINDRKFDPLLAVARRSGLIEVLSPVNGDLHVSMTNASQTDLQPEDDPVVGLHMFRKQRLELSSRSSILLTCTTKGNASMRSVEVSKSPQGSISSDSPTTWNVCAAGNILCSKVDGNENYALFGGKGVEVNVWDLDTCSKIWNAKSPAKDSLGIFTPTWFTSATFLSNDDHRKIVAGTNSHQVHLYDISAQRRPVISIDFRESAIKAVAEDLDGNTVYIGTGSGDLASFDMRTGKLLGCYPGKCSGSIRSIARHPDLPVLASCGLDCYLRIWDVKSRQLLSAVFLKQHLSNVVFDSNFDDGEVASSAEDLPSNKAQQNVDDEESLPVKRKKASKECKSSKRANLQEKKQKARWKRC
ncbi:WD repeat-containing protein [Actinidia chinensis var. chinensis]|uniref:WD repeat-containing protein n=1 Tax=Actinidia chinensis var. chinensis TaxID=1590841 RepID=A0A2R6Q6R4_ACTCC|nr:WD repeat-containing protein [Actinidia chinensis var. chinensis]